MCACVVGHVPLRAAISLSAIAPLGATGGVTIQITGLGFGLAAGDNEVILTPAVGPAVTVPVSAIAVVNATAGLRRLAIVLPEGLPVGTAGVQVRNRTTGEVAGGRTLEVIALTIPEPVAVVRGTTGVAVRVTGSPNTQFVAGRTGIVIGVGVTVTGVTVTSPTELVATVNVGATAAVGPGVLTITATTQSGRVSTGFTVVDQAPPNQPPTAAANGPYAGAAGEPIAFSSAGSSDPDGDPLQFAWAFGDGGTSNEAHPQHTYAGAGVYTATLTVSDGRGGTAQDSAQVSIAAAPVVTLDSISVAPPSLFFSDLGATAALTVTGHYSDGSEQDLTAAATGTTYATGDSFVAVVDAGGVVTSVANGQATITVSNSGLTATVDVVVEQGVSLSAIELTPPIVTLRELGSTAQTTVRAIYSDDSIRDLTADPQTTYVVDDDAIAAVSATGLLTSVAPGVTTLTASHRGFVATAQVRVLVTDGELSGLLRGEALDDSRGLPLANVIATVVTGSGPQVSAGADERGQFVLPATAGAALVRVTREGFTQVDRQGVVLGNAVTTLLDARLTPLDSKPNALQSVFGGEASSADGSATVSVPPGALVTDVTLRVTPVSNQGLAGLLPPGWSPIAAVDLAPAGIPLSQAATVRMLHTDSLVPFTPVVLVAYDAVRREWIVQPPGQVSADGRSVVGSIDVTGQFAFVVPDEFPAAPPVPADGSALAGVLLAPVPAGSTATGQVVPRSAPPGDDVRAVGAIVLQPAAPLPSGTVLRARVSEQFDLLDASRVLPQPFVQDLVVYQRPRLGDAGTLATRLPVTPSIQFSIQQLSIGTVLLDVTADESGVAASVVGAGGGSVADAAGNVLEIPPGLLPADVAIGLVPLTAAQLSVAIPAGYTLLGAVLVDAVAVTFPQPAGLSIVRPSGLDAAAQVLVAQVMTDSTGGRRLRIIGVGALSAGRIAVETVVGSLTLDGVRSGGEFVFLQPADPHGFLTGTVTTTGLAQAQALVTADTAPFAFLTGATGTFVVAGRVGPETTVAAIEPAGAAASAAATLAMANGVATLQLALTQTAPVVLGTSPAANAVHVALDVPIVIDFSKAIDPATVTPSSVVLSTNGTTLVTQAVLSANRRRLTVTPMASLAGLTPYTLTLTDGVRDTAGIALAAFTPLTFTTLDPTKAPILALGVVTATLPDEDGLTFITGAPGAAEPGTPVVATNLRTQETTTTLASADGSFRLRLFVIVGDEVALTLRDADRRETTLSITQFGEAGGPISVGESGGTIQGPNGRVGRILPRALDTAGIFQVGDGSGAPVPALPASFAVVDRFTLTLEGASFRRLDSLTLSESQGRFQPASAFGAPFAAASQLTVPPDFLLTASLRFTATATDRDGARRPAMGTTVVVGGSPDGTPRETGAADQFPTVFLTAPAQAVPTQVLEVSAIAPAARVDLELPGGDTVPDGHIVVLARLVQVAGEDKLSAVDRFSVVDAEGHARLRTTGRELPGASRTGEYLAVSGPIAFITGRASGPAAIVTADGSPFVYETDGANGAFILPVPAGAPFTLRFLDATTLALLGMASGQAPGAGGRLDVGQPLAPAAGTLTLTVSPDAQSLVDINAPLVFTFSEPLDRASVTSGAFVITEETGARVFGSIMVGSDNRTVTFVPLRRWRTALQYGVGVNTSVSAASGARLAQPFVSQFSTFAPRVLRSIPTAPANDVAVRGGLAVVATDSGLAVADVHGIASAAVRAQLPLPGGARGVDLLPGPSFTDRTGQVRSGTFAVVAAGNAAGTGRLEIVDAGATTPVLIGSAQVTTPVGQSAPAGVPAAAGTPHAVVVTDAIRALAAVRDVGLQAVDLADAVPADAASPGRALRGRYPAGGVESVSAVARLGDRVLVAGAASLTSLDAATLQPRGTVSTTGHAAGVAVFPAYSADLNADGSLAFDEVFDLAVVANGTDGTLQFYRVPVMGDPVLLSVVRFADQALGVAVDVTERLAYVSLGARGLALVDLDGPMSVQPLDTNHDGVDDRILGMVDTPGLARRTALALDRGLGFVADGPAGLAVIQLLPARTRFLSLQRDPLATQAGDEEPIGPARPVRATDDAVRVSLNAAIPEQSALFLTIEETPDPGGARRLSFADGTSRLALANGLNDIVLPLARLDAPGGSVVTVRAVTATGAPVASTTFRIEAGTLDPATVSELIVPSAITLGPGVHDAQLAVGGRLFDGQLVNVTAGAAGATYTSSNPLVVQVTPDGRLLPQAGGVADIIVRLGNRLAIVSVTVQGTPVLQAIELDRRYMTFVRLGEQQRIDARGELTDGTSQPVATLGAIFESQDPGVVVVDASGTITAVGAGTTIVGIQLGTVVVQVSVAVEPRTPPVLTAIDLTPFPAPVLTTDARAVARAVVTGTGSLEGLEVRFTLPGSATVATAHTDYAGVAAGVITGLTTSGPRTVTASVVNPAGGATLSDAELLVVELAGVDLEPNNTIATATPVALERPVTGSLGGGDLIDMYRARTRTASTATVSLTFPDGTDLAQVRVVFFDSNGVEVGRVIPSSLSDRISQSVPAGNVFVAIESLGAPVTYSASLRTVQAPVTIASVSPFAGGPGTPVTILGTGFSTDDADVRVLFGGIPGRVVSSTPTRLDAVVPAHAKDGPVTVIVTARRVEGPAFVTGNTAPRAPITVAPTSPDAVRFDPALGVELDVTRLIIFVDALATRADVEVLAQGLGGSVVGENTVVGFYVLEFPANQTLAGLAALTSQVQASALVRSVGPDMFSKPLGIYIDLRDGNGKIRGKFRAGATFARAQIFAAIEAIRSTPPYDRFGATFQPVKIGVIDSGFEPVDFSDYVTADGRRTVRLFLPRLGRLSETDDLLDLDEAKAHGTGVTSIIAALNNGGDSPLSGGLGGLLHAGEESFFEISVYAPFDAFTRGFPLAALLNAIGEIADRGDIDIVNMSLGMTNLARYVLGDAGQYRDAFALLGGRTLVVAAGGNEAIDGALHFPSGLAETLPFVIAVGATESGTTDLFAIKPDSRASFSNFGDALTLAAPGVDLFAAGTSFFPDRNPYGPMNGTSAAAPVVTAIAGLLLAIRPPGVTLDPEVIRAILVDTGDTLEDPDVQWGRTRPITRVNALNAVRMLLPPSDPQMIYISDGDANGIGHIIGIDVVPETGARPTPANPDVVIPLTVTKQTPDGSVTLSASKPTTLLVSPAGDELFVVVDGGAIGYGVLVINTSSNQPVDFIPFSGAGFPAGGGGGPPVSVTSQKPPMVFSKDGRLLYVGAGRGLRVINVATRRLVQSTSDLPGEYRGAVSAPRSLAAPLSAVEHAVQAGVPTSSGVRAGHSLSGLALSPDGRTLYAAVSTGGGGGYQPGGVLAIDVDLYRDASPDAPGLQADLSTYLTLRTPAVVAQADAGGTLGGDEPQGIAVSADGRSVYLVNGGMSFFEAVVQTSQIGDLTLDAALPSVSAIGGVQGLASALSGLGSNAASFYAALSGDIATQAAAGVTFVGAPGVTGVFAVSPDGQTPLAPSWAFPSSVAFGWNPTSANGGSIINQFRFRDVFSKRPFGLAMRPDGQRAIVPMFQTGNFGILDLDVQTHFLAPPVGEPKPGLGALSTTMFQGLVGVTGALHFDANLWPSRGAFTSGTQVIPSPDENFLYTWHAEYAQNGRWAVAVHTGVRAPSALTAVVPPGQVARLEQELSVYERGQQVDAGANPLEYALERGGGGLTIIRDEDLRLQLVFGIQPTVPAATENGTSRTRLATVPVCGRREPQADGTITSECATQTPFYHPGGGSQRFFRPRGVTVQPFVVIQAPRHGDHVSAQSGVQVVWRDSRVRIVRFQTYDLDQVGADGHPTPLHTVLLPLSSAQIDARTASVPFGGILGQTAPAQGRRYRIRASAMVNEAFALSLTAVDVTFDARGAGNPIDEASLTLTPFVVPAIIVPTAQPLQLRARFEPTNSNDEEDVTAHPDIAYLWAQNPAGGAPLVGSTSPAFNTMDLGGEAVQPYVESLINEIKARLTGAGSAAPFSWARVSVTPDGRLSVMEPGLTVVQAAHLRDDVVTFSNPVVVLAGLALDSVDLEPVVRLDAAAAVTGAGTLMTQVDGAFGLHTNVPLILAPTVPNGLPFFESAGEIQLEQVEFLFQEQWRLRLQDLMASLARPVTAQMRKAIVKRLGPANPVHAAIGTAAVPELAKGLAHLIHEGDVSNIAIELVDLRSSSTAAVASTQSGSYTARVLAAGPGLVAVKGDLALGGFGRRDDTVPVFVLPHITEAELAPMNTLICRADSPEPGVKLRTLAVARFGPRVTFAPAALGASEGDLQRFFGAFLPGPLPVGAPFDVALRQADFEVRFRGAVSMQGGALVWDDPALAFTVPNIAGITSAYTVADAPDLVRIGSPRQTFSVRVLHQGVMGFETLRASVQIPLLASAQAIGSVLVTDLCSPPFAIKEIETGGVLTVEPGTPVPYTVTAFNPTSGRLLNVSVTDTATFRASQPTGNPELDEVEIGIVVPIGTLEPHTFVEVPILVPTLPGFIGLLSNTATVSGTRDGGGDVQFLRVTMCQVLPSLSGCSDPPPLPPPPPPPGVPPPPPPSDPPDVVIGPPPIITEMVLAPRQDWNDSSGGNGVPFDRISGTGTIDGDDVWIEVTALSAWETFTIRLTDATGATFSKVIGPVQAGLSSGVYVVTGFGVGTSPIVRVDVIDQQGIVRQSLDIAAIEMAIGGATGADDESLTWSVFGNPSPLLQQFVRRAASIGLFRPY